MPLSDKPKTYILFCKDLVLNCSCRIIIDAQNEKEAKDLLKSRHRGMILVGIKERESNVES